MADLKRTSPGAGGMDGGGRRGSRIIFCVSFLLLLGGRRPPFSSHDPKSSRANKAVTAITSDFLRQVGVRWRLPYRTDLMVVYGCIATTGGSKSALIFL
jgi:hypothetical protein